MHGTVSPRISITTAATAAAAAAITVTNKTGTITKSPRPSTAPLPPPLHLPSSSSSPSQAAAPSAPHLPLVQTLSSPRLYPPSAAPSDTASASPTTPRGTITPHVRIHSPLPPRSPRRVVQRKTQLPPMNRTNGLPLDSRCYSLSLPPHFPSQAPQHPQTHQPPSIRRAHTHLLSCFTWAPPRAR